MNSFSDFSLYEPVLCNVHKKGITEPTEIQVRVIPAILNRQHLFFESETGTGKTAAFLLPLITMHKDMFEKKTYPVILIVTPTVELASQIKEELNSLTEYTPLQVRSLLCTGSSALKRQIEGLKEKPSVIIGTPARIADLISLKKIKLHDLQALVIDEADRQLADESRDSLQRAVSSIGKETQIIACSATFKERPRTLLAALFPQHGPPFSPLFISAGTDTVLKKNIEHWAFFSERKHKTDALRSLIHALQDAKILIFAAPAHEVETITQKLRYKKLEAYPLYSKMKSADRKAVIGKFKSGKIKILVTSDLSARGMDIPGIEYVIQMSISKDTEAFIHRAGRTGRAGGTGVNIIIGDEYELRMLQTIEKKLGLRIQPKMVFGGKIGTPEQTEP